MLNKVEIRTSQGDLLSLPLGDISNGFVVKDIQGLDPAKATIVTSSFAGMDGSQYHHSRVEMRNILMKLGFLPDYSTTSVRDLRLQAYKFFMPKSEISLRFYMDDDLIVDAIGRVETSETLLFTREPEINISILCFDPNFVDPTPIVVTGSTVSTSTETLLHYAGSVETGILFELDVNRTLTQFTFYHRPPDGTLRTLDVAAALVSGDVVKINTVPGSKSATLTHSSTDSSMLYAVTPQSNWIQLVPGDNYIRIYATGAAIPYSITYDNRYGGL